MRDPHAIVRPIDLPPDRRVIVVSDIHGNLPYLKGLLRKICFCPDDILIVLGDMMERSVHSLDTLRYVMELSRSCTVYPMMGNCDDITPVFVDDEPIPQEFYDFYFPRWGEKCAVIHMAHLAGVEIKSSKDFPAAREAIKKMFPEELDFLRNLPTVLLNDDYLFVHGGVPRETRLDRLTRTQCLKNDNFLGQGRYFKRWVIVGHWPVTLYRPDIPSASPIVLYDRHIASIDGGCTLKLDGQLNALILPEAPGGQFTWESFDGYPVMTAMEDQKPSENPINIRWGRSQLEVLEEGEEFCLCRHLESGRVLPILTNYLRKDPKGVHCEDSTDYRLPVKKGDKLRIVQQTSRGTLAKKDGVTGWYLGPLREL